VDVTAVDSAALAASSTTAGARSGENGDFDRRAGERADGVEVAARRLTGRLCWMALG
jgi:hypothetical protein